MKKYFYKTSAFFAIFSGMTFFVTPTFANTESIANSCQISNGPISEMIEYRKLIDQELANIESSAPKKSCEWGVVQNIEIIFDSAHANISAFDGLATDFAYNTKVAFKGETYSGVRRDEKFFDQIEKRTLAVAKKLAQECRLTDENKNHMRIIIQEAQLLKRTFQNAALGNTPKTFSGIRSGLPQTTAQAISKAYNPNQTVSCVDNSLTQEKFATSIKTSINFWAKKEETLASWKRAIALIRGGKGMNPSDYTNKQRQLLQAELSRQWFSGNAQKIILQNFDCYKSKTLFSDDPIDLLKARASCLSSPLAWVDNIMQNWNRYTLSAPTLSARTERQIETIKRTERNYDIVKMYNQINALSQADNDETGEIINSLIQWHIELQWTNELLEMRLPAMQKNCMKWQPDILGGCRS